MRIDVIIGIPALGASVEDNIIEAKKISHKNAGAPVHFKYNGVWIYVVHLTDVTKAAISYYTNSRKLKAERKDSK